MPETPPETPPSGSPIVDEIPTPVDEVPTPVDGHQLSTPELVGWTQASPSPYNYSTDSDAEENTRPKASSRSVASTASPDASSPSRPGCFSTGACNLGLEDSEGDADAETIFVVLYVLTWLQQQPGLIQQPEDHRIIQVGPSHLEYDDYGRVERVWDTEGPLKVVYRVQDGASKTLRGVTTDKYKCDVDVEGKIEQLGPYSVEHDAQSGHVVLFRSRVEYRQGGRATEIFGKELSYDDQGCLIGIGNSPVYYEGRRSSTSHLPGKLDLAKGKQRCIAQPCVLC